MVAELVAALATPRQRPAAVPTSAPVQLPGQGAGVAVAAVAERLLKQSSPVVAQAVPMPARDVRAAPVALALALRIQIRIAYRKLWEMLLSLTCELS